MLKAGSKVRNAHGAESIAVNSFHHQAVREPAPDFIVTGTSEDGIIEAIEHKNCKFAVECSGIRNICGKEICLFKYF